MTITTYTLSPTSTIVLANPTFDDILLSVERQFRVSSGTVPSSGTVTKVEMTWYTGLVGNSIQVSYGSITRICNILSRPLTTTITSSELLQFGATSIAQWTSPVLRFVKNNVSSIRTAVTFTIQLKVFVDDGFGEGPPPPTPPPPPLPSPTPPKPTTLVKHLSFLTQPPSTVVANTDYTVDIGSVWNNNTPAPGVSVRMDLLQYDSLGTANAVENGFVSGSGTTSTILFTTTGRSTSVTFKLAVGIPNGLYRLRIWAPSDRSVQGGPVSTGMTLGGNVGPHLRFGTQPPVTGLAGTVLANFTVETLNASGTLDTGVAEDITVALYRPDGETAEDVSKIAGALVVESVAGVSTFTGIVIVKPGIYTFKATAGGYKEVVSNVIVIGGTSNPEDASGLRQNILRDGTLWGKTTGISAPTIVDVSTVEQSKIDGDLFSTEGVVCDGFRFVFPYWQSVKKIAFKNVLSTLAGSPVIRVYKTTDATEPDNGTWEEVTTFIPKTLSNLKEISFAVPVLTRGLWVTLDDSGGAATSTWRAIHVFGLYIEPALSFHNPTTSGVIGDEELLSIPLPAETLEDARTVTRDVIVRNNSTGSFDLTPYTDPAKYGGDSLVDIDNVSVLDENNSAVTNFTLNAQDSKLLRLRYTIAEADNDKSGKHLIRLSFLSNVDGDSVLMPRTDPDVASNALGFYRLSDGIRINTVTATAATSISDASINWSTREIYFAEVETNPYTIQVRDVDSLAFKRTMVCQNTDTTALISMSGMACAKDNLFITTTSGGPDNQMSIFKSDDGSYIGRATFLNGSSTHRHVTHSPYGEIYVICKNSSSEIRRYDGVNLLSTGTTSGSDSLWWDGVNDILVTARALGNVVTFKKYSRTLSFLGDTVVDFNAVFGVTIVSGFVLGIVHTASGKEYIMVQHDGLHQVYTCTPGDYTNLTHAYTMATNSVGIRGLKHVKGDLVQ